MKLLIHLPLIGQFPGGMSRTSRSGRPNSVA